MPTVPEHIYQHAVFHGQLKKDSSFESCFLLLLPPLLHPVVGNTTARCRLGPAALGFGVHLGLCKQRVPDHAEQKRGFIAITI